jgi:hypothetical protein
VQTLGSPNLTTLAHQRSISHQPPRPRPEDENDKLSLVFQQHNIVPELPNSDEKSFPFRCVSRTTELTPAPPPPNHLFTMSSSPDP